MQQHFTKKKKTMPISILEFLFLRKLIRKRCDHVSILFCVLQTRLFVSFFYLEVLIEPHQFVVNVYNKILINVWTVKSPLLIIFQKSKQFFFGLRTIRWNRVLRQNFISNTNEKNCQSGKPEKNFRLVETVWYDMR